MSPQDQIMVLLRQARERISGEAISRRLGISRAAVWKNIRELRGQGYAIGASTKLGYHLVGLPDKLYAREITAGLSTRCFGRAAYHFETLASTMPEAARLAADKAAEGTVVVAEQQTKGKGRMGREWVSPSSGGIYLSLILRPPLPPRDAAPLTLLTAVSWCAAVNRHTGIAAGIKWPNDILCRGKKVAGILTEMSADMDRVHSLIIGVGLNVNTDLANLPPGATALSVAAGKNFSRVELLKEILTLWEQNYFTALQTGWKSIFNRWRQLSVTLGRQVQFEDQGKRLKGEAVDIDSDGGLLIRIRTGKLIKKMSGDVSAA
ncbi:MAG: biotin--[acetyl-CoA-carboxylase] ligase [Candidatus Omnitrophica bacterium]|nr:biotin--[acetyl-CoA-carboxylase] ligase [Candidatus Omnitrophota bacterium]